MPVLPNQRHELFAQALALGDSMSGAFVKAGYTPNPANALRLSRNEKVALRIKELKEEAAKAFIVTAESIAAQLDEDRALALRIEKPGDAVAATVA